MNTFNKYLINKNATLHETLEKLNFLGKDAILFIEDEENRLVGSLTDGDLRRGFIKGLNLNSNLLDFIQPNPKYIQQGKYNLEEVIRLREKHYIVFPVVDEDLKIINVVNFSKHKSYLPVDALILAGGKGERLKPLTNSTPKPLLYVGEKPIIEHNIDRLNEYGIDDIWISIKYLGEQIQDYFKDGLSKSLRIKYVKETEALGTIGSLSLVEGLVHDTILVMNSDLLTNINFEEFYLYFQETDADFAVVTIPYQVNVPYAVLETSNGQVMSFKEKPTYTYYSNGGIYLMKKEVLNFLPKNTFFNATDLMEKLIAEKLKVISYPLVGYWLDIGKHEDFEKAQSDIKHIKF